MSRISNRKLDIVSLDEVKAAMPNPTDGLRVFDTSSKHSGIETVDSPNELRQGQRLGVGDMRNGELGDLSYLQVLE